MHEAERDACATSVESRTATRGRVRPLPFSASKYKGPLLGALCIYWRRERDICGPSLARTHAYARAALRAFRFAPGESNRTRGAQTARACPTQRCAPQRSSTTSHHQKSQRAPLGGPLAFLAEREGFEPSMQLLTAYSLSRGAPSASRASLRNSNCMSLRFHPWSVSRSASLPHPHHGSRLWRDNSRGSTSRASLRNSNCMSLRFHPWSVSRSASLPHPRPGSRQWRDISRGSTARASLRDSAFRRGACTAGAQDSGYLSGRQRISRPRSAPALPARALRAARA